MAIPSGSEDVRTLIHYRQYCIIQNCLGNSLSVSPVVNTPLALQFHSQGFMQKKYKFLTQRSECTAVCYCAVFSQAVVSDSLQHHGLQSARLFCPWGFSRQEYWRGLPCTPPGELHNPGTESRSSTLQAGFSLSNPPESP